MAFVGGWENYTCCKPLSPDKQSEVENIWFNWAAYGNNLYTFFLSSLKNEWYNEYDTGPDLFYFEIPGASGMFVFDHNGQAITIPYQNIKIQWNREFAYNTFEILDNKGNLYIFDVDGQETITTQREKHKFKF